MYTKQLRTYKKMGFDIISGNHQVIMWMRIQKYAVLSQFHGKKAAYFFAMRAKLRPVDEFLL